MSEADPLILAIDQGTSATKGLLLGVDQRAVASSSVPLTQTYPQRGWVEQSPEAIWDSVRSAVAQCVDEASARCVAAVGFSTQRESMLLWDRHTGEAVGPMIGWQDQRSRGIVARLQAEDAAVVVRERTGLVLDPMFSAAKAAWLLDRYDPRREASRRGDLLLGTVDSWLLHRLGGDHLIEAGNAARTQLFNLRTHDWDDELLELFDVPRAALPEIVPSTGPFPNAGGLAPLADSTPVCGILGDSHAAMFAHAQRDPAAVKATYGTGSSVMALIEHKQQCHSGLCVTLAWQLDQPQYAFEGNIRASAATLSWAAGILGQSEEELIATGLAASSDGVHLVPAFTGLGAPWWDMDAVAVIRGFTLATSAESLARATAESIAFQIEDVVALIDDQRGPVPRLLADGGPAKNGQLMQLQADLSGRTVESYGEVGLSALGAGLLAGAATGVWDWDELEPPSLDTPTYEPRLSDQERREAFRSWHEAIALARTSAPRSTT